MQTEKIEGAVSHKYAVPEGLSVPKELEVSLRCQEFCYSEYHERGYIGVRDDWCPVCGWPATWTNSKWRKKQGSKQAADKKARDYGVDQPCIKWLIATAETANPVPGAPVTMQPTEIRTVVAFVERNGFQALQDTAAKCPGEGGRGLIVHVIHALQFYRPTQILAQERSNQAGTPKGEWVIVDAGSK